MKLIAWPTTLRPTRGPGSVRTPIGDPGVGPFRRPSQPSTTSLPTMIRSQGDSNLCASISVSNVLSYALRRYLLEENVIPGSIQNLSPIFQHFIQNRAEKSAGKMRLRIMFRYSTTPKASSQFWSRVFTHLVPPVWWILLFKVSSRFGRNNLNLLKFSRLFNDWWNVHFLNGSDGEDFHSCKQHWKNFMI